MILHVSVTADDPRGTAETLALLLGGRALPIGPGEGSWSAVGPDPVGNVVEVLERGSELHPAEPHVETRKGAAVRHGGFHILLESPMSENEIFDLAEQRGASAQRSSRGFFGDLIEFWIDDCLLVEVLPPSWAQAYRQLLTSDEVRKRYGARHDA